MFIFGIAVWGALFYLMLKLAVLLRGTYYQETLYFLRIALVIPFGALISGLSLRLFDAITPASWVPDNWELEYAKAAIVCSVIIGLFWLAVQG